MFGRDTLFALFPSSNPWAKFCDPEIDRLLRTARNTLDEAQLLHADHSALERLHDNIAVVPSPSSSSRWRNESFFLMEMQWQNY
jgi:ABC-type transport system substrate-binding protein